MGARLVLLASVAALAGCGGAEAEPADGAVHLRKLASFDAPLYVTAPPGDTRRVFVVEQGGKIRVVRDGKKLAQPFLDVSAKISAGGERGLLSMAFAPDYAHSGLFYVDYTDTNGNSRIVEYQPRERRRGRRGLGAPGALPAAARAQPQRRAAAVRARQAALRRLRRRRRRRGPARRRTATRRTSARCWARSCASTRAGPGRGRTRSPPRTRSCTGRGARGEIYSYGLRNPWRFSFDRRTGDMSIGDVGQDAVEEIDFERRGHARGQNFGWRVYEGRTRYNASERAPGAVFPVITERHADGNCSITGGVVVRDPALPAVARPLRVRRPVPGRAADGQAARGQAGTRAHHEAEGLPAVLVRRGRAGAGVRGVAGRAVYRLVQ